MTGETGRNRGRNRGQTGHSPISNRECKYVPRKTPRPSAAQGSLLVRGLGAPEPRHEGAKHRACPGEGATQFRLLLSILTLSFRDGEAARNLLLAWDKHTADT